MSEFITRIEQPDAPGLGQQQVVQQEHVPMAPVAESVGQAFLQGFDMYGNQVAQEQGQAAVTDSIQDLEDAMGYIEDNERALATAEEEGNNIFPVATDRVPDSVNMSQQQFDMLRSAVKSGEMTRSRARLHASKLVRERISEAPMFADRIRESASDFLGFDPRTERTRQYFGAFPTESEQPTNTFRDNLMQEATTISEVTGVSVDHVARTMMENRLADMEIENSQLQYDMDQISGREYLDQIGRQDSRKMYKRVFGEVMALRNDGQPVDAQTFNSLIEQDMHQHLAEVKSGYQGNTTDSEFVAYRDQVRSRYDGVKEYIETIGIDNLNEQELSRMETMVSLRGLQEFPDFAMFREAAGEQGFNTLFDLLGRAGNDEELSFMMQQFPALETAYRRLNQDPEQLRQELFGAGRAILEGGDLSNYNEDVVDVVAVELYENGDEQSKNSTVQDLAENGYNFKLISMLGGMSPRQATEDNINWYKEQYEGALGFQVQQIATDLAAHMHENPDLITFEEDGTIQLNDDRQVTASDRAPITGFRSERRLSEDTHQAVERLNAFRDSMNRGWSRELGVSPQEHVQRIEQTIRDGISNEQENIRQNLQQNLMANMETGTRSSLRKARSDYGRLQEMFPEEFSRDFEEVQEEVQRRLGQPRRSDTELMRITRDPDASSWDREQAREELDRRSR